MGRSKDMFPEMNQNLFMNERSYLDAEREQYEREMFQEIFVEPVKVVRKIPRIAKSSYLYKRKLPEVLWNKTKE